MAQRHTRMFEHMHDDDQAAVLGIVVDSGAITKMLTAGTHFFSVDRREFQGTLPDLRLIQPESLIFHSNLGKDRSQRLADFHHRTGIDAQQLRPMTKALEEYYENSLDHDSQRQLFRHR